MTSLSRMLPGPGVLGISTKVGGEGDRDRRQAQGGRTDARTPRRAAGDSSTDTASTTLVCMSKYARVPVCVFVQLCKFARICSTHKTTQIAEATEIKGASTTQSLSVYHFA